MRKDTTIFANGGKVAGIVRGKTLDIRKHQAHLLHTPPAIAIGVDVLREAKRLGADEVTVTILETSRIYRQTIANIKRFSQVQRRSGYEPQHVCPLVYWQVIREGTHSVEPLPEPAGDEWRQLSLGGER